MRRLAIALSLAIALVQSGCTAAPGDKRIAAAPTEAPKGAPKLVVAIAVDQLSADAFAQYRVHYRFGMARLLEGAVFPSGYQSHAATETCPGHSTLLTGARPSRTGIIANNWYDPGIARPDKRIYCAEDEGDPASTSRDPVVSARHLKVPTLGEWMQAANPRSRNVAVSAKDRAVAMMGGRSIDAGYWWKGQGFATFAGRTLSPAVQKVNADIAGAIKAGAPAFTLPVWCTGMDRPLELAGMTIGTGHFAQAPGKADAFRVSPRMDAATADLALALVDELQLGNAGRPDMLSVSFSASDYIGHAFGSEGAEMCIAQAELDRTIGRLLDGLDARGIDYLAVLSADHGGIDVPERLAQQALPAAGRAGAELSAAALGKAVSARTGIATPDPLIHGDGAGGDYYFSHALSSAEKARASAALVALLKAHPQVAAVFTAQELAETPQPSGSPQDWSLKDRARASFDPLRSGDVIALLARAIVGVPQPGPGYATGHGSPWDYDRRVPILFWRKGLPGLEQPAPVETVDIAPTLAAILGLGVPDGAFDGRCLDIDGGEGNSCAGP